jgi:hypothetical protein
MIRKIKLKTEDISVREIDLIKRKQRLNEKAAKLLEAEKRWLRKLAMATNKVTKLRLTIIRNQRAINALTTKEGK